MQATTAERTHRFPFSWEEVVRAQERRKTRAPDPAVSVETRHSSDGGLQFLYTVSIPWWARALLPAKCTAVDNVTQDPMRRVRVEVLSPGPEVSHLGQGTITSVWEPCPSDPSGATKYTKVVKAESRVPQSITSRALDWYLQGAAKVWQQCEEDIAAELAAREHVRRSLRCVTSPRQDEDESLRSSFHSQTQFMTPASTPRGSSGSLEPVRVLVADASPSAAARAGAQAALAATEQRFRPTPAHRSDPMQQPRCSRKRVIILIVLLVNLLFVWVVLTRDSPPAGRTRARDAAAVVGADEAP
eukprot:TRINITY_DN9337_c1_g2_i1.p1 TRINITY_DN9337_c1_g2~~TRINITY_DN9337_c1_g2_i1.p1  ORF type:complete len:301 (+),score=58.42 TRINITY_DN9337_c1_g2_i1:163-1065(+)